MSLSVSDRTEERLADVGRGIELCYRTTGDPAGPPLLLIMGLGQQLIAWRDEFVDLLADRGFFVVRFDNRDVGRSTRMRTPPPSAQQLMTRRFSEDQYVLADMAADTAGLLDALEIDAAHIVGISMGGMIAQTLAAQHPERVRTLTSIMSTTGARRVGWTSFAMLRRFLVAAPRDAEAAADRAVETMRMIGSHGFALEEAEVRALAIDSWARAGGSPAAGLGRQTAAILKSGDRTEQVRTITAPTLVIHGDRDAMVHPSGGKATAAAIGGAELLTVKGMGHNLPRGAWPAIVDAIAAHAR